ncbi:hypothetical protein FNV43_RR16570 [Rhamnella rubrinervis]|uniref:WRC domain-containing protein n=1 Tax=Rhamnella rubrinervis TaxID=2594499 RepID=A0A8K0MC78_9ROSA|nr:hypothetical protein FNV43_RR16570 [Rhamnella rubrinervis]
MRIRKRQVPFPLSSLSPVPLSDPLLNLNSPSPVVQLHHYDSSPPKPPNPPQQLHGLAHVHPQPSDRHNQHISPIGSGNKGWDVSDAGGEHKEKKKKDEDNCLESLLEAGVDEDDDDDERGGAVEKSNDIRKETILGAKAVSGHLHQESSCSSQAFGRWCEGEKVFPLKKRRGSFERGANGEKDKKAVRGAKMKTKMNKKCARKNDVVMAVVVDEHEDHRAGAKKRGRGGGLMEGSRCSRVNGRGWRCCQQTLVGYSLCEHHLGKGRLRSMTSVRSRSLATTSSTSTTASTTDHCYSSNPPLTTPSTLQEEDSNTKKPLILQNDDGATKAANEEEVEEKKPLMTTTTTTTKKRMKLGMVKARSISSLLGQTNSAISVSDNAK